jgi:GT2 family glycosyltransferase
MNAPLVVMIAACQQPGVLRRTLASIAACEKPATYSGTIVVENGPRAGLDRIVAEFSPELRFAYWYSEPANKSLALNRALATVAGSLVVFTDDDVQVPGDTLLAYARAAVGISGGEFYGGPIVPQYEAEPPPNWLRPLLPRSAAGWRLDVATKTAIRQPEFIGPNMAAFANDVLRVGGFDTRLGPGRQMQSPGEDTEIQVRLLANGVRGYYLPDAPIQHWVRAGACGVEFAITRAERNGIYWGISQGQRPNCYPRQWMKTLGQWLNDRWRIRRWRRSADEMRQVRSKWLEARWRGRWQGLKLAREWQLSGSVIRQAA